jgi:hypothetical protein
MASYANADFKPAQYNIQMWKNDTWNNTFTLLNEATPINLTGATVEIQIRKKANSTDALATLTIGSGITISGASFNVITVAYNVDIDAGSYVYDMAIQFSDGTEKTYIWGIFIIYEDVTKITN